MAVEEAPADLRAVRVLSGVLRDVVVMLPRLWHTPGLDAVLEQVLEVLQGGGRTAVL